MLGADISWPQCPPGMGIPFKETSGQPMPRDDAEYVVIGLTNGPGFHANPCLADQVAWARERGLLVAAYSVISWPDEAAQAKYGGLVEAGTAQAQFNLQSMKAAGLDSPIIWLDIEQVPHYEWSTSTAANAEVVLGAARGYAEAGYRIGVYSTPAIWAGIVGDLSLGVPEWRAAGQTSKEEALSRCSNDWLIQGGIGALASGSRTAATATSPARAPRPSWATTSGTCDLRADWDWPTAHRARRDVRRVGSQPSLRWSRRARPAGRESQHGLRWFRDGRQSALLNQRRGSTGG